jgi:hypothetical protein
MEKFSRKSFEEATGKVLNQVTMYFSPILFQARETEKQELLVCFSTLIRLNE